MDSIFNSIADGLADQGYAITDHFLNEQEAKKIITLPEFQEGTVHFKKAGIGQKQNLHINEAVRGDYIKWLDKQQAPMAVNVYLERLRTLIQYLNQNLFLSLKDVEVHMTIYPVGSFYKRHLDQFKSDDHRKLSVICYLNENWEESHGGQLRLHLKDGAIDVLPTLGKLVCFRSDEIEHEVLPATRERLSITGWILDQVSELRHL